MLKSVYELENISKSQIKSYNRSYSIMIIQQGILIIYIRIKPSKNFIDIFLWLEFCKSLEILLLLFHFIVILSSYNQIKMK